MAVTRILMLALVVLSSESITDFSRKSTTIETDSLPTLGDGVTIDGGKMPSIGNGHMASVVYSDTVYVNGVYNGEKHKSHRARLKAEISVRVHFNEHSKQVYRQYKLDMENGYWEETITSESCRVRHRVYAHQTYTRLMVVEITAERQPAAQGNLMLYLNKTGDTESDDITFLPKTSFNGGNWCMQGTTKSSEIPGGHQTQVYVYWSLVPPIIHIPSHKNDIRYTYIMAADTNNAAAKEGFESGSWISDKNPEHFFMLHKEEWRRKWEEGRIQLTGEDNNLEKLAYSSLYYLLSSLPSSGDTHSPNPFGGASATGLAHGSDKSNRGHVSWDQEMWILPALLPFSPSLARTMLSYRVHTMPAAKVQAAESSLDGLLYSWRSAATGIDVTPPYLPRKHYHINGDISLAVRRYISVSRDRLWLQEDGGCEMIKGIAAFWYSLAKYNSKTRRYDINDVTPPDDSLGSVDNSVYTNAVASLSLHYSKYAACMCNIDVNTFAPYEWLITAQNLHWHYNNSMNFNPESKDFLTSNVNKALKEPGAIFLNYPVMWSQRNSTTLKNIKLYGTGMPSNSPPTSFAIAAINLLELGDVEEAHRYFEKSYSSFVQEPFKVWTKYPANGVGNQVNYLSGMGSYLQVLLYGFGGLRIHTEFISLNPKLPPNIHTMTFKDLDYLGSKFTVQVKSEMVNINVKSIGLYPLILTHQESSRDYHLVRGASIHVKRGYLTIYTKSPTGCPLPEDNILPVTASHYKHSVLKHTSNAASITTTSAISRLSILPVFIPITHTFYITVNSWLTILYTNLF